MDALSLVNLQTLSFTAASSILKALLIIVAGRVASKISKKMIKKGFRKALSKSETKETQIRIKTLESLVSNISSVLIYTMAAVTALSMLGFDIGPILAGAGILGLAVGFGTQTLVKDMVSGFFIILEGQYNVGDKIEVAGYSGKVKAVNIRTTVLEDENGNLYFIPNSTATKVKRYKQS